MICGYGLLSELLARSVAMHGAEVLWIWTRRAGVTDPMPPNEGCVRSFNKMDTPRSEQCDVDDTFSTSRSALRSECRLAGR
jgi:hypothetical protein